MFLSVIVWAVPCENTWIDAVALLTDVSIFASTLRSTALCYSVIVLPRLVSRPVPPAVNPWQLVKR